MTKKTIDNRGRKPKIYDENLILQIINDCKNETGIIGLIKYSEIYKFAFKHYNLGKYPQLDGPLSEDYWRKPDRQGRIIIDKYNSISSVANRNTLVNTIDTEVVVNEYYNGKLSDKKKLISILRNNEKLATKLINSNSKLKADLLNLKESNQYWKLKAESLQVLIFQIVEKSSSKDSILPNLINTGNSRSKYVDEILKNMFSDDETLISDFESFKSFKESSINNLSKKESKIVSINRKKSAIDDFGEF